VFLSGRRPALADDAGTFARRVGRAVSGTGSYRGGRRAV